MDGDQVWWPDYPGNKLFNSFGNLAVNPEAALLFPDFGTGRTLYLSGTAEVDWDAAASRGMTGAPAGARSSRCGGSWRAACYRRARSGAPARTRSLRRSPAEPLNRLKGPPR